MCPRQGSPFSLLRQRKGTKSSRSGSALTWRSQVTRAPKATPLTGRPRADCSAVLGLCRSGRTHYAACGRCVQTAARSQRTKALRAPAKPCAPRRLRRAPRAIRSFAAQTFLVPPRCASARAKRASSCRCEARRIWCSSSPSDELSSAGLCGARVSAHPQLTSGGCLNAVSVANEVSSARPAKSEQRKAALAPRGPSRQGSLLCLLSCRYKKGGRPPGRNPGAASCSEQEVRKSGHGHEKRKGFDANSAPATTLPRPAGQCAFPVSTPPPHEPRARSLRPRPPHANDAEASSPMSAGACS